MQRRTLLATTLILALGCDKAREMAGMPASTTQAEAAEASAPRLDLTTRPDILFQVYGDREDPRMIPLGVLRNGTIEPIILGSAGWRQFDSIYGKPGAAYTIYEGGRSIGNATVRQGMWEEGREPLYTLPSCELLVPQSAVKLSQGVGSAYTVSLFASSRALGDAAAARMSAAEAAPIAREIGAAVAVKAGISPSELDALEFRAVAVQTGATAAPTIIATFIDRRSDEQSSSGERTVHVFAIADRPPGAPGYQPTFVHTLSGDASTGNFKRYVDHLDVTGDGQTEIVVEAWQYGGDTHLAFLQYRNGAWADVFRARPSWCLDSATR